MAEKKNSDIFLYGYFHNPDASVGYTHKSSLSHVSLYFLFCSGWNHREGTTHNALLLLPKYIPHPITYSVLKADKRGSPLPPFIFFRSASQGQLPHSNNEFSVYKWF
jgi:hypothetical protein